MYLHLRCHSEKYIGAFHAYTPTATRYLASRAFLYCLNSQYDFAWGTLIVQASGSTSLGAGIVTLVWNFIIAETIAL